MLRYLSENELNWNDLIRTRRPQKTHYARLPMLRLEAAESKEYRDLKKELVDLAIWPMLNAFNDRYDTAFNRNFAVNLLTNPKETLDSINYNTKVNYGYAFDLRNEIIKQSVKSTALIANRLKDTVIRLYIHDIFLEDVSNRYSKKREMPLWMKEMIQNQLLKEI